RNTEKIDIDIKESLQLIFLLDKGHIGRLDFSDVSCCSCKTRNHIVFIPDGNCVGRKPAVRSVFVQKPVVARFSSLTRFVDSLEEIMNLRHIIRMNKRCK